MLRSCYRWWHQFPISPLLYVICLEMNPLMRVFLCLGFSWPVCHLACHLHCTSVSHQAFSFSLFSLLLSLHACLKVVLHPCQPQWDKHRCDVMAAPSDSPQILHALTGLDCGWDSKMLSTIGDTSERMGLTPQVISLSKPAGDNAGQIHSQFSPR